MRAKAAVSMCVKQGLYKRKNSRAGNGFAEFDELLIFALLLYFCIALFDHFLEHGNARDFKSHTQSDIRILEFFENVGVETIVGLHVRLTALKKIGHAHIFAQLIAIQVDELDFQACAVLNHRHTIPTQIPQCST